MRRALLLFFALLTTFAWAEPLVLVSVPPLEYYVERLVGEAAEVSSIVPAGANPHTYAPTPRQVTKAAQAVLWFRIGESFEPKVAAALEHAAPDLKQINLLDGLPLIQGGGCLHCSAGAADPHIWLSAQMGEKIVTSLASALKEQLPVLAPLIDKHLAEIKSDLAALDGELTEQLAPYKQEAILVSHPAFGYFCRDYDLEQIAVEHHGKEPTPRQLTALLQTLEHKPVRVVILQANAANTGAKMVANHLDLPTCTINPLAKDIPHTLRSLGTCIAQ